MNKKIKPTKKTITETKVRAAVRKIVAEEYSKLTEAPAAPGAIPGAEPEAGGSSDAVIGKLMDKIPNLPAVQQLIRRIPQRAPKAAAEIIMAIISAMEAKTSDPKSRLISRELIYLLRDKIKANS